MTDAKDLAIQNRHRNRTRGAVIADAKLGRIMSDADRCYGAPGPWRCDHSHILDGKGGRVWTRYQWRHARALGHPARGVEAQPRTEARPMHFYAIVIKRDWHPVHAVDRTFGDFDAAIRWLRKDPGNRCVYVGCLPRDYWR